jgi:ribosomal protein S6--L-glutamate ligase
MTEKATIAVVNGERYWHDFLPNFNVRYCQLQTSQWFFDGKNLFVFDAQGTTLIDSVLWRVGAIRPHPLHRAVLEIIRLSGVVCVNSAESLLRGFDRLSMRAEMQQIGIPIIPQIVATGRNILELVQTDFPCVVKIGNFHAGLGKIKIDNEETFTDVKDLSFAADDYITVEPFIDYVRDIRCLIIGDNIWGLERRGETWKANTQTIDYNLIEVPAELSDYTVAAKNHLQADILGLDFLETQDGRFLLLETNDIPGLSGFPDSLKYFLAQSIENKIQIHLQKTQK